MTDAHDDPDAHEELEQWSRALLGADIDIDPTRRDDQIARALAELDPAASPPDAPVPLAGRRRRRVLATAAAVVVVVGVVGVLQLDGSGGDATEDRADVQSANGTPSPTPSPADLGDFATVAELRTALDADLPATEESGRSATADEQSATAVPEAGAPAPAAGTDADEDTSGADRTGCEGPEPVRTARVAGRAVLVIPLAPGSPDASVRIVDAITCAPVG